MPLVATFSTDRTLLHALGRALAPDHGHAEATRWRSLVRLVVERPVGVVLVDHALLNAGSRCEPSIDDLRRRFPHLGIVVLVRRGIDPLALYDLGRRGVRHLVLLRVEHLGWELRRQIARACRFGAPAVVARHLSPYLSGSALDVVRSGMDTVHRRLDADEFAQSMGWSRPHLSQRLKARGLPSTGHLLIWCRLLHAAQWLVEPGRTAESVSRQLEYSSGAAFRRALKRCTDETPTGVIEQGGLRFALGCFVRSCGLQPALPRRWAPPAWARARERR